MEYYAGIDVSLEQSSVCIVDGTGKIVADRKRLLKAIAALDQTVVQDRAATPQTSAHAGLREAERRQLTVMFVDLVGSTALSQRLDPEEMSQVLRDYQNAVAGEVTRFEGHVTKYMGDGVLAYFGWPHAHEDDADRSVRAGLAAAKTVAGLKATDKPLAARVGIATGIVVVGDLVGEGTAREETVVGDTPNLAARLQALAEPGGIVISKQTRGLVGEVFETASLGVHAFKGFGEPIQAWSVVGIGTAESRFDAMRARNLVPLVGREHELGLLLERWRLAKSGEGQVVLLAGDPGIGKSRLTASLLEGIADEPHVRLRYYCSSYHTGSGLHPVIEHVERAAGFVHDDGPEARLDKLEAVLGPTASHAPDTVALLAELCMVRAIDRSRPLNLSPQVRKARTFETLLARLETLARDQPILMLLEDAHWIDPSTSELFDLTIDRVRHLPVLLVVTFRPELPPSWPGRRHVTLLRLDRLGSEQRAVLTERLTAGRVLPEEILDQIVQKSDGVPLFVEELTRTVLESGILRASEDRYVIEGPPTHLAIPATLHDALLERLNRLGPAKEIAQIGSVIGRRFSHDLLVAVAPARQTDLQEGLNKLIETELIGRRRSTYVFKHALVRDAAYESLLRARRIQLHARIAHVLEDRFADLVSAEPELLAHHFTEVALSEQAVRWWLRAGEHATGRSAYLEAIALLERGLALVPHVPDISGRRHLEIDLQSARGTALIPLKGQAAQEVGACYARAETICSEAGETTKLYPILQGLWHFHSVRAELGRARELAERCRDLARADGDPALVLAAHVALCGSSCFLGEFDVARQHLERALRIEDLAPPRSPVYSIRADLRVFLRGFGSYVLWNLGYADQAVGLSAQAADLAREAGDPFSLVMASDHAAMIRQFRREISATGELASAAVATSSEHGFAYYFARATFLGGWASAAQGNFEEGISQMRRGLTALDATGGRLRRPYYLALLAEAHSGAEEPDAGLAIVDEGIALAEASGERWRESYLRRIRGRLLLADSRDRGAEAEACFRDALAIAQRQHAKALELQAALDLARHWAEMGDQQAAVDLLAPVYGWFSEGFDTQDLTDAKALLEELT